MGAPSADVFRAIADPTRRRILVGLAKGPRSVGDICEDFDISQPSVSAHLEILRDAGLVGVEPDGRRRLYSLDPAPLGDVTGWLAELEHLWKKRLGKPRGALDVRASKKAKRRAS